jgi:hypothetical protein
MWARRWSRALVRHRANPRLALAAVLGVASGNIQVQEAARSSPPVKANTVPTPRPSNPNPNTEEAARPSTAGPGSPSEDN